MTFYNSESYIREAIDSVLNQSFQDFELILINDGSTDKGVQVVEKYNDERIRLINNKHDYITSLNLGMSIARGEYIARMDADDIMHPDRLFVQYTLMEEKPEVDICSSWCTFFNVKSGKTSVYKGVSGEIGNPLLSLLDDNLFTHSSMFLRRSFVEKVNLKYQNYPYAEDYKLCFDAAKAGAKFYIEPQSLLFYRCHEKQVSISKRTEQDETTIRIKGEIMEYMLPRIPEDLQNFFVCLCKLESMKYTNSGYKYAQMYKLLKDNNFVI